MGFRTYNSGIDSTCKDCSERYPACHDSCERYIQARKSYDEQKRIISEARNENRIFNDYKRKKIARECKIGENKGKSYKYYSR